MASDPLPPFSMKCTNRKIGTNWTASLKEIQIDQLG